MFPGPLWALLHLNDCLNARLPHHPPTLECDHCTVVPCLYLANILTYLIGIMFIGTAVAPNNWMEVICKSFIVTFPCKWFSPVSSFPLPNTGKLLAPTYHGVTNKTLIEQSYYPIKFQVYTTIILFKTLSKDIRTHVVERGVGSEAGSGWMGDQWNIYLPPLG